MTSARSSPVFWPTMYRIGLGRRKGVQARQDWRGAPRPFFLYIDEFHHFATPSMATLRTGARKYAIGLVLAHQDLRQLGRDEEVKIAAAVLANPAIRLAFRVSEQDARKLAEGFSSFDPEDLTRLSVGEAICRIERSDLDFNLKTLPLPEIDPAEASEQRKGIIQRSRQRYRTPREEIEAVLQASPTPEAPKFKEKRTTLSSVSEPSSEAPESRQRAESASEALHKGGARSGPKRLLLPPARADPSTSTSRHWSGAGRTRTAGE